MGVSITAYRAAIGSFNNVVDKVYRFINCLSRIKLCVLFIAVVFAIIHLVILLSGDIEVNPGPKMFPLKIGISMLEV